MVKVALSAWYVVLRRRVCATRSASARPPPPVATACRFLVHVFQVCSLLSIFIMCVYRLCIPRSGLQDCFSTHFAAVCTHIHAIIHAFKYLSHYLRYFHYSILSYLDSILKSWNRSLNSLRFEFKLTTTKYIYRV